MDQESLHYFPMEKWSDVEEVLKSEWPRYVSVCSVLETQKALVRKDLGYGFKVYCPYGDVWNGFIAVNEKEGRYEVLIQCPKEDTTKLEAALKTTKLINWQRAIKIPFAPDHVIKCIRKVIDHKDIQFGCAHADSFILEKDTPLFNIRLPDGITLEQLSLEHVELVNSKWPHRYPTSNLFFQLLIKNNSGFGLFQNNQLISWAFIGEYGTLCHLYTLEEERRKGYGEQILKIVCNVILKENKNIVIFGLKNNVNACKLYRKIGCKIFNSVAWMILKPIC